MNYRTIALSTLLLMSGAMAVCAEKATYIDIPAQSLGGALRQLADQTGLQLAVETSVTVGKVAPAVRGELSHEAALEKVLEGSGLRYKFLDGHTVAVSESRKEGDGERVNVSQTGEGGGEKGENKASVEAGTPKAGDEGEMQEILVTAQKRTERLQDVPISMSVLNSGDLDRSSARGITDVLNQIGGVTVTEAQPGGSTIVVRGVVPGIGSSTTAYYLDEVPFGYNRNPSMPDSNSFDLARVEVLRGPQGTLYGANSLSGVVRVLTTDANVNEFELKGRTRVSSTEDGGGNYGGDLVVNVPLVPGKLAVRAVAGYSELSGFIDSTLDGQDDINDTKAQNYRLKMSWQPSENLSAKLGYSRSIIENGASYGSFDNLTTPFSSNRPGELALNVYNLVAEYKWPSVSLLSSTGYVDFENNGRTELLLGGTGGTLGVVVQAPMRTFTQEFRFSSQLDGAWRWSAGAIYKDTEEKNIQAVPSLPSVFPGVFIQGSLSELYAVFGDVTRSFDDGRFEVTAGLRYADDREMIQDIGDLFPTTNLVPDQSAKFEDVTGRLVLSYKPRDRSMLYASVATGSRNGAIQSPSLIRVAPDFPPIDPDSLMTYELGVKGELLEGKFAYDTAVYYMDWKDIQQSLVLPPPSGFTARVNAGKASGVGVDTTVFYRPSGGLTLQASVGWNDLKFDENIFNFNSATQQNLLLFSKGSRVNDSPEWTGSVGAGYRMAMPKAVNVDLVLGSNFAYSSQRPLRFLSGSILSARQSDEMRLLEANIGLESERWSLDLYGDNLLNDDSAVTAPDVGAANTAIRLRPRTIGLQVNFNY